MKRLIVKTFMICIMAMVSTFAQNKIHLVRYQDDFTSLKNDTLKKGLDQLKYIPLGKNAHISFGGELRQQFQWYDNINFGDVPPNYSHTSTPQLWHRLMGHTDLELGNKFRVFMQLSNTLRFLNDNPNVPEIDENQLSLHQAIAEIKLKQWNILLGRQEVYYGNHRLITVREGPNTRQAFDGLKVRKTFPNGRIDLFTLSKVVSKRYVFDDESMHDGLVGIYGTQYYKERKIGLDYYMVNFQSQSRKYNYQSGFENRLTNGIRLFSQFKKVNFEFEAAYQYGKFADLTISAYSILADINWTLSPSTAGIIGIAANVASGDKNPKDGNLNTYNLLYAKPAYGLAAPIGATNMISINPYIKINPANKLHVLAQIFLLSRHSSQDGTYSPGMVQNRPRPDLYDSDRKALGALYVVETHYQQTKNLSLAVDTSYFDAGNYPTATGKGKDITYLSFKATYKF